MYDINLLPRKLQRKFNIDLKRTAGVLALFLVTAGFFGGYYSLLHKSHNYNKELTRIENTLEQLSPMVTQVKQLHNNRIENEKKLKAFQDIVKGRLLITPILEDISLVLPEDLWLTEFSMESRQDYQPRGGFASPGGVPLGNPVNNKQEETGAGEPVITPPSPNIVKLQGVAHSAVSVGVFVDNMSRLPYFSSVDLLKVYENNAGGKGHAFTVMARLKEDGGNVLRY